MTMANAEYIHLEQDEERDSVDELLLDAASMKEAAPAPAAPGSRFFNANLFLKILKLLTWVLAFFGLYSLLQTALFSPSLLAAKPSSVSCDCGSSISEAISMDCKYDSLAAAWLPPACRDDELTAEFNHAGPGSNGEWEYFADKNATQVLTLAEVALLPEKKRADDGNDEAAAFFVSFRWHIAHCVFYWRKMFRAGQKGTVMEGRYQKESHIEHCAHAFLDRSSLDQVDTRAVVMLKSN